MTVPLADLTVDLVLYAVSATGSPERSGRLVLRRTVFTTPTPAGGEQAAVEELWVSDPVPAVRPAVRAAFAPTAAPLLLAEPVPLLPGLHRPTYAGLDELAEPAAVAYLAGCRATVRGAPGRRALAGAEVVGGSGTAAHVARSLLLAVVGAQGLVDTAADSAAAGPTDAAPAAVPVRAELLADLADARTRLEQADLWRLLTGAPLGGWEPVGPDLFRLTRLGPGPATLTAGDDPDLDRTRVTFIEGAPTTLVCHHVRPPADVLRRADVTAALAAYSAAAADPGADPEHVTGLRQRAIDALGGAEPAPPVEPRTTALGGSAPALHGTVVVHDDRAIPVGNRIRRFATTVHVLTPSTDAAILLQARPDIVRAVVDHACTAGDVPAGAAAQQDLAATVCGPDTDAAEPVDLGGRVAALLGPSAAAADPMVRLARALDELGRRSGGGA